MLKWQRAWIIGFVVIAVLSAATAFAGEEWRQFKRDRRHSGNAPDREVSTPLRRSRCHWPGVSSASSTFSM